MEEWRAVPGYEGVYEVSDLGRVRSLDRVVTVNSKFGLHPRTKRGRFLQLMPCPQGYLQIEFSFEGVHDRRNVHSVVATAFLGPRPEGMVVCHNDGDQKNNRADNLRYDTLGGNSRDRFRHGTMNRGSTHALSKLTEAGVSEIIRLHAAGTDQLSLARQFGVSRRQINNLVRRVSWRHLDAISA